MESGKQYLGRDTAGDAIGHVLNDLKRESADLKHLVPELSLNLHRPKKLSILTLDESRTSA